MTNDHDQGISVRQFSIWQRAPADWGQIPGDLTVADVTDLMQAGVVATRIRDAGDGLYVFEWKGQ